METGSNVTFRLQLMEICVTIEEQKRERRQKRSEFIIKFEDVLDRHEKIVSRKYSRLGLHRKHICRLLHKRNILPQIKDYRKVEPDIVTSRESTPYSIKSNSNSSDHKADAYQRLESAHQDDRKMTEYVDAQKDEFDRDKSSRQGGNLRNASEKLRNASDALINASGKSRTTSGKSRKTSGKSTRVTFAKNAYDAEHVSLTSEEVKEAESAKETVKHVNTGKIEKTSKTPKETMKQMNIDEINKYLHEVLKAFRESQKKNRLLYVSRERSKPQRDPSKVDFTGQRFKAVVRQTLPRLAVTRRHTSSAYQGELTYIHSTT